MRHPNGYGGVYKLSGKRRKPWLARVTDHWEPGADGERPRQIYRSLGTFATRAEALAALAAYHADPHAIPDTISFSALYAQWSRMKFPKLSASGVAGYTFAYRHCAALHDMQFSSLRAAHLQAALDQAPVGYHAKSRIKVLLRQLYAYALENDHVTKDYSAFIHTGPNTQASTRRPFTPAEIERLWQCVEAVPQVDSILILIYSGWRVGELLALENARVDVTEWTFQGGKKTAAGKNRIVPIHPRIQPLVARRYDPAEKYLFRRADGAPVTCAHYRDYMFHPALAQCGIAPHVPHDCRHTTATLMDNAGANRVCIKRILGHSSGDLTERVYTHKALDELRRAIACIP